MAEFKARTRLGAHFKWCEMSSKNTDVSDSFDGNPSRRQIIHILDDGAEFEYTRVEEEDRRTKNRRESDKPPKIRPARDFSSRYFDHTHEPRGSREARLRGPFV